MAVTQQATALIGVFPARRRAEHFVTELRAGFRDSQIGVAVPGDGQEETRAGEGAVAGTLAGGAVGALAGMALVAGVIPGVGPVLVGGLLTTVLVGAATGAVAGGGVGTLIGLGIPDEHARHYAGQLQAGRTLVVVQPEGRVADALAVLRRCDAEDVPPDETRHEQLEVQRLPELPAP